MEHVYYYVGSDCLIIISVNPDGSCEAEIEEDVYDHIDYFPGGLIYIGEL